MKKKIVEEKSHIEKLFNKIRRGNCSEVAEEAEALMFNLLDSVKDEHDNHISSSGFHDESCETCSLIAEAEGQDYEEGRCYV